MKKNLGIFALLVVVCLLTAILNPKFLGVHNLQNTIRRIAPFGILGIGVAFVIITGGIDLSIGSVVGLVGALLPWLLMEKQWSVAPALLLMLGISLLIGLTHGLLITKLKLQPFVVTLCGLLIYRSLARYPTDDQTQGFATDYESLRQLAIGKLFGIPVPFLIMIAIALAAGVMLNHTIWGRYLLALGCNEEAARFSGINTDRMVISSYMICSLLAGLGGMIFALDVNSILPAEHGSFFELYAIAAAVLGGCSLRGGEGSILGVLIGTAVIRVLYNSIILLEISHTLEYAMIGTVLLAGVIVDEMVKRLAVKRRAAREARETG